MDMISCFRDQTMLSSVSLSIKHMSLYRFTSHRKVHLYQSPVLVVKSLIEVSHGNLVSHPRTCFLVENTNKTFLWYLSLIER